MLNNNTALESKSEQSVSRIARISASEIFLRTLYKSLQLGNFKRNKYGYLWIKKGGEKLTLTFDMTLPAQILAIAITAVQKSEEGYDVFYSVCLTDLPMPEHIRAKKNDVSLQTSIWVDIDIIGGVHVGESYPTTIETAMSFLPFKPSIIVNSGYGLHAYYLFSKALLISDYNRDAAEARNKKLISIIRHNAGIYEKAVDSVQDLSRIMRMPGTFNYKSNSTTPPLCRVIEINDVVYRVDELDDLIEDSFHSIHQESRECTTTSNAIQQKNILLTPKVEIKPDFVATEVTRTKLIQILKTTPFETFFPKRDKVGGWICPKCGSGSGVNGTGITQHQTNKYRCWNCGKYGDLIDWIQYTYDINFNDALKYGANVLNLKYYDSFSTPVKIDSSQFKFRKDLII